MSQRNNVRPSKSLLTDNDVRELLSPELIKMCAQDGPSRVAIDIGCEEKTVRRARDKETSLRPNTTFNLLARDTTALDPILAHFGLRTTSVDAPELDIASIPCDIAAALPTLIRVFHDGVACDNDIRQLDREGIIDKFAEITDMLVQRRDAIRLRVVGQ